MPSHACYPTHATPLIPFQALWKLLGTEGDERPVTVLYGNKTAADVLMKEELDGWAAAHPSRLKLVHVVGETADAPAPDGWVNSAQPPSTPDCDEDIMLFKAAC